MTELNSMDTLKFVALAKAGQLERLGLRRSLSAQQESASAEAIQSGTAQFPSHTESEQALARLRSAPFPGEQA